MTLRHGDGRTICRRCSTSWRRWGRGGSSFRATSATISCPPREDCAACDWSDLLLAERGGRLVGIAGGLGPARYRQSVVHGYSGWLRWLRPLYNAWQRLRGLPGLPRAGRAASLPDGGAAGRGRRRSGRVRRAARRAAASVGGRAVVASAARPARERPAAAGRPPLRGGVLHDACSIWYAGRTATRRERPWTAGRRISNWEAL